MFCVNVNRVGGKMSFLKLGSNLFRVSDIAYSKFSNAAEFMGSRLYQDNFRTNNIFQYA